MWRAYGVRSGALLSAGLSAIAGFGVFAVACCAVYLWAVGVIAGSMPATSAACAAGCAIPTEQRYFVQTGERGESTARVPNTISKAAALRQLKRVAAARRMRTDTLRALVAASVEPAQSRHAGAVHVNVLALNLALDLQNAQGD